MTIRKAFVLLSGGLDSTTALALASLEFKVVVGVSVDYGQRHKKELECARKQCSLFGCETNTLNAGDILRGGMLTERDQQIPDITYDQIEGVSPTYVPFRNGTLLSMVTAHAQRWVDTERRAGLHATVAREAAVYFGAHAEDAHNWAYPDCTPEFIGAMSNAIYIGTYKAVRLVAPLMWMKKSEIVKLGHELGVQFQHTWSCYAGGELHCGKCPTCYARQQAFRDAGVHDPTVYAAKAA